MPDVFETANKITDNKISGTATNRPDVPACSAGFQTCIADFQVGRMLGMTPFAGLETHDTADLEVCATGAVPTPVNRDDFLFIFY
jgi:hypothetical protein